MQTKYLKDYVEPNYWAGTVDLTFTVLANYIIVTNKVSYSKNKNTRASTLELSGEANIQSILVDDKILEKYKLENNQLFLEPLSTEFTLTIITHINPWQNKTCMGLYASGSYLLTQCEPEGFRKITYYLDRPDVMAVFTTTIIAKDDIYPVILSNGNKISQSLCDGIKTVSWRDPFKKPCYLFALVLGKLDCLEDYYITKSGREVKLEIYTEGFLAQSVHAMESLKRSMKWDEERFGLEYDLNIYMIVATHDFNMGAMENKGLNIFNAKYILADKLTATDTDFINVESVIGHEYFHNWSGNRVTCKNWFQLSLKEGLTVFRDQEFTADMHDATIKRIEDVQNLKHRQFVEDSSALSHSVRPDSYVEVNNFYTATVYDKGAEVVRMYQTILGRDGFNRGLKLYFVRHDGFAVSCEDFYLAMSDANKEINLDGFMHWYNISGTPKVIVKDSYNQATQEYILEFTQLNTNMLIPIKIGLLNNHGFEINNYTITQGRHYSQGDSIVLLIDKANSSYVFSNIAEKPIPSLLRDFSAPIKLEYKYTSFAQQLLIKHDSNLFNRYEQLQNLFVAVIKDIYTDLSHNKEIFIDNNLINLVKDILINPNLSAEFRALALTLPSFANLLLALKEVNPQLLAKAIECLVIKLGEDLFDIWLEIYNVNLTAIYNFNDYGKRSLKNIAIFYIFKSLGQKINNTSSLQLIETLTLGQFNNSDNMTDSIAVLFAINSLNIPLRETIFTMFYNSWHNNELIMDKWFALQAVNPHITLTLIDKLMLDKAFNATNPNKIYALLGNFSQNSAVFNTYDSYSFIADKITAIDSFNPHVASYLANKFSQASFFNANTRQNAKLALQKIAKHVGISIGTLEIVNKVMNSLV